MNHQSNARQSTNIISNLRVDCFHFKGDRPCDPHSRRGAICTCDEFVPLKRQGIIIKLGAAGDVIRTTPLLRALDPLNTGTRILWITHYPELLPKDICEPLKFTAATLALLQSQEWDFCWNLDKDIEACAIASQVKAKERAGYTLIKGMPYPMDTRAWHKFATGLDNEYSKQNQLNYVQEIFDIVGIPYKNEEYCLRSPSSLASQTAEKILPGNGWVGLNTGAGWRWPTRIWPESHWIKLLQLLTHADLKPVILGGPEEEILNNSLALKSGCLWPGIQTLDVFYALIQRCDALVSSVTQAMHLAIAAKTPLILFNNIFNSHEFELYGRGEIVSPPKQCDCFYDATCKTGRNCIQEISPENAFEAILRGIRK